MHQDHESIQVVFMNLRMQGKLGLLERPKYTALRDCLYAMMDRYERRYGKEWDMFYVEAA